MKSKFILPGLVLAIGGIALLIGTTPRVSR
jgi:hypothetical protein